MVKIKKNKKSEVSIEEYTKTLIDLKNKIREAQVKTIVSVNKELLKLYWDIGETIAQKQEKDKWGSKTIERLANDLQNDFPGIEGFSPRNILRMRSFYLGYQITPQPVAQITDLPIFMIPWGHNALLLEKIKNYKERLWYAQKTIENGWSRASLLSKIKSDLYNRDGKAISNFNQRLPSPQSALSQQATKDPFVFDFLTLHEDHLEKELEHGLVNNIQKTLLELGKGFAFYGRQVNFNLEGKDYYIDLLFYHVVLHCFCVVEIKARDFDPKDAGQINFYLAAVNNLIKGPKDNPTIGLLLCQEKNRITVEWALDTVTNPIAVASYMTELTQSLPKNLKGALPTIKEIEQELKKNEILSELEAKPKTKKKINQKKTKSKKSKK